LNATEIKALRESLGLSQIELADKLGMHPATVCRWEKGKQRPTRRAIKQLLGLKRKEKK